jgi:hypothetical protein
MTTEGDQDRAELKAAKAIAEERIQHLNEALSAAAFRFGAVSMKLAIGAVLRHAGLYAEATIAVSVPVPVFQEVIDRYDDALSEVRATTETKQ